jgi:acetyl-CoA carboxylase carboxyl transferase subunit beta|tara:strand:+ start:693 stop:1616 length:924 start_codon:yes stop_codon:yes gene_type:complete
MNWITRFIKPKIKSLFKKKSSDSKEALWTTCECKNLLYKDDLFKNLSVCPTCGFHHKLSCEERFKVFFDNKEYEILKTPLPKDDPLKFPMYSEKLKQARKKTNQSDAILIADGKLEGIRITVGAQNFNFIGGAVGAASGEAFIHGVQYAIDNKTPFIFFSCSGGQKMQEGAIALMQMTRTVLAVNELKKNNLPFIVVMCNPTTGGVSASFATLGDILIGESSKAIIAFAGARVIANTVKEELPKDFQTADFVKEHGGLDLVVERKYLRPTIFTLLSILLKKREVKAISETDNVTNLKETLPKTSKAV